ncbi:phosphotransferase enzyme family protein [Thermoflavimicrobium daqui]|uniref:Aminoglycoside phosphotransferase domain-containing protein n=1 Tax=Thermoflavimicrobium daqui TaxID=2137476 RepID=A0A364K900_9BACL|nr:phosphotransferase [Thermoflavimicrobium daqui]RAL26771.1 hypothetical protein DL897_01580 [Thermoflavimicrobium daqui]
MILARKGESMGEQIIIGEILHHITSTFRFQLDDIEPIQRGYQNRKWFAINDHGKKLFIKCYSSKRYPSEKMRFVRIALQIQSQLHEAGVVCPKLYGIDGKYIFETPSGFLFCMMDACDGDTIHPGEANWLQMFDLGRVTGYMHQVLNDFPKDRSYWSPTRLQLLKKWRMEWEKASTENCSIRIRFLLKRQREIIDSLQMQQFEECEQGWAHWDLWMENILFQGNLVSAILDFDRMKYVYPDLDIARAIMSGAFISQMGMDMRKVAAFIEGYRTYRPITKFQLARAFRLLWCKEAPWWYTADIEERSENPRRFFEEMCWLMEHWWELEDIFDIG